MKHGIIVRKTLFHVDQRRLDGSEFAFVEADAYARLSRASGPKQQFLPMISSFLGSKTWLVKRSEAEYLRSTGASKVLFFPDLRNVKYGCLDAFHEEAASVDLEIQGMEIIYYIAVDCLTREELNAMIAAIADSRFEVMLGFGGCKSSRTVPAPQVVAEMRDEICADRLWCAFWEVTEFDQSSLTLEQEGIQRVAALL